jgi:hypothetical protein
MTKLRAALVILPVILAGCEQTPSQTGAQVGNWLDNASKQTGQAIGTAGDRTGEALQNAGSGVRNAVAPPSTPPSPYAY